MCGVAIGAMRVSIVQYLLASELVGSMCTEVNNTTMDNLAVDNWTTAHDLRKHAGLYTVRMF